MTGGWPGPARTRVAFVDESQSDQVLDPHTYVLAAAVCEHAAAAAARQAIAALKLKGEAKLHWHAESGKRRHVIAETIASMSLWHLVVVRDGRPEEKGERRRRHCLERLLYELDQLEVGAVTFESRGARDDQRDRVMLDALRARKAVSHHLRISHVPGLREAPLWTADAVCGAVVRHRLGDTRFLQAIQAGVEIQLIQIGPP